MKVLEVDGNKGLVEAYGVQRETDLAFVNPVEVGSYVLVHAGFAIQTIDEKEALETQKLLAELAETEASMDDEAPRFFKPGDSP